VKINGGWSWILDFFYACMRMKILCVFKWRTRLCLEDKMLSVIWWWVRVFQRWYYDGRKGLVCGAEWMEVWILLSCFCYGEGDGVLVNGGEEEIYQKSVF